MQWRLDSEPMRIDILNLEKKQHEEFVLSIPELYIPEGQSFGLVGNNGAGKTTLLRLILDLIKSDKGSVSIGTILVATDNTWKEQVGAYLDESFLIDYLTPREFFSFIGSLHNLTREEVDASVEPFRNFLTNELLMPRASYIRDLSTGNAKKVGIVAALFTNPHVVILDEPFANLDPRSQIALKTLLRERTQKFGMTLLVSSHDLTHVTEVCSRIVVLEDGQVIQDINTEKDTLAKLENYFASQV